MMSFTFVFFISALHITGVRSVKVGVSSNFVANSPTLAEYFVEERHARLKCYIIGEGDTNTTGSSWYRNFSNGTIHQFTDSDPERVRVHENTLVFWPKVIRSDQGWYRCCVSTAVCSNFTYVKLYVAPIIDTTRLNYIAFIGSHVTLTCEINNWGNPKATISWKKPEEQYFSNDPITTNETHTSLILPNVTTVHGGKYVCDADSILSGDVGELYLHIQVPPQIIMGGPMIAHIGEMVNITCTILKGRPAPDINISTPTGDITKNNNITFSATLQHTGDFVCTANTSKLIVTEKRFLFVYDIDNTTSYLHFLVLIHSHDCHFKYETILSIILKEHIFELCKCNVSVSIERFDCISDGTALYYVKLTGYMAGNIKQFLQNDKLGIELDSTFASFHVCTSQCKDSTDQVNHNNTIAIWMASSSVVILSTIIFIFVIYKLHKFLNHVIMNKCVAREETSTDTTPNPLARVPQSTFELSHLTTETVLEDNEAVPANNNEMVASSNGNTSSSIQPNGDITTTPIQSRQHLQRYFVQTDRGNGLERSKYENMVQKFPTNFASTGTDV